MASDKVLIVRDRHTSKPISIPTSSIPPEIQPDNWFSNPDWRWRPDRGDLEPLIRKLFARESLGPQTIQKLAQYIVDYACHIAVAAYIFGGGHETLEFNAECVKKLRAIRDRAKTKKDIREMIHVGMDYALDPF